MSADAEIRFRDIETALKGALERLGRLEAHGLPGRVDTLEAGMLRVERQLDLVFMQGQSSSRALGEQRVILDRVDSLLEQLVHQRTPSVEVSRG